MPLVLYAGAYRWGWGHMGVSGNTWQRALEWPWFRVFVLSDMEATGHMKWCRVSLKLIKTRKSAAQSHTPHFKCSVVASWGWWSPRQAPARDGLHPPRKWCWTPLQSAFMCGGPTFPEHISSRCMNKSGTLFPRKKCRELLAWWSTRKEGQEEGPSWTLVRSEQWAVGGQRLREVKKPH